MGNSGYLSKTHSPTLKTHNDTKHRYENKWIIFASKNIDILHGTVDNSVYMCIKDDQ